MYDRLTLATSTGLPFLILAFHVAMGVAALAAGYVAIVVRKGGTWHRRSGAVFVYTIIAMGLTAVGIAGYEGKPKMPPVIGPDRSESRRHGRSAELSARPTVLSGCFAESRAHRA